MGEVAVEVVRGERVESRHRVDACVVDATGTVLLAAGPVDAPVYPRSAVKPFQALPLVEVPARRKPSASRTRSWRSPAPRTAASRCTSSGWRRWLARLGLDDADLALRPASAARRRARQRLIAAGAARAAAQQLLGQAYRHARRLLHQGWPTAGYARPDHPLQRKIARDLAEIAGLPELAAPGIDGCSLPAFVLPLRALALAASRLATVARAGAGPHRPGDARPPRAGRRHRPPLHGADGGRPRGHRQDRGGGRVPRRVPSAGLGIALKAEDGATRAAEVALLALLDQLGLIPEQAREPLSPLRAAAPARLQRRGGRRDRPAAGWPA